MMQDVKKIAAMTLLVVLGLVVGLEPAAAKRKKKSSGGLKTITYTVKKGDTLDGIAKRHKTSVAKLKSWNKSADPKSLRIGQKLRIAVPRSFAVRGGGSDSEKRMKVISRRGFVPGPTVTQRESDVVDEQPFKALEVMTKPNKLQQDPEGIAEQLEPGFEPDPGFGPEPERAARHEDAESGEAEGDLHEGDDHEEGDITDGVAADAASTDESDLGEEPEDHEPVGSNKSKVKIVEHTVLKDENVGTIALRYEADYEDVLSFNELKTLTPEPGTKLKIRVNVPPPKPKTSLPVTHRVARGESLTEIANKYRVTLDQIKVWNKKVNPRKLRVGQLLNLHVAAKSGRSQSVGTPNRGRLYNGVPMESTPGIRVRSVSNAYGTQRVVNLLKAAGADVKARWPETPHLVVGDISYRHGGRIKKHKSHQSGRDIDVSFYHRGDVQLPDFRPMHEDNFDAAKNWHIFKTLIDTGSVQYIFIDYTLQKPLYEYARAIGYTEAELANILQYPRGLQASHGIIRHVRGHDDHWHIRFKCDDTATRCRD